jgi:hypothetical protein
MTQEKWFAADVNAILKAMTTAMDEMDTKAVTTIASLEDARSILYREFVELAEGFNHARDTVYNALPVKLQRRGDFDTMEVRATVEDEPGKRLKLKLVGVWGSVGLIVTKESDGYCTDDLNGNKKAALGRDALLAELGLHLAYDNPQQQERNEDTSRKIRNLETATAGKA